MDTGATNRMTCDIESLSKTFLQPDMPSVQIPNGATVKVHATGQIDVGNKLILEQVLGVANFCFNLLFVCRLTKDLNCLKSFCRSFFCDSRLSLEEAYWIRRERNGLYYLELMRGEKAFIAADTIEADLWHRRLWHLLINRIHLVPDLSVFFNFKNLFCNACCRAKTDWIIFSC